jgi:hypothetical protein
MTHLAAHPFLAIMGALAVLVTGSIAGFLAYYYREDRRERHQYQPGHARRRTHGDWDAHDAETVAVFAELHHEEYGTPGTPGRVTPAAGAAVTQRTGPQHTAGRPAGGPVSGASPPETPGPASRLSAGPGAGRLPPMSPRLAAAVQDATDAERYPDLMHGYGFADRTGEFTRIVAEVA